jgi:3-deoxy-D-manno-octulosonic-acid transferase
VPVVMGPHYENFRDAVELLRSADALRVVERARVGEEITSLLANTGGTATMGMRGKKIFEEQAGATQRAVDVLVQLLSEGNA